MSRNILNTELTEEEISEIKKEINFNDAVKKKDTIILIVLLCIGIIGLAFVLFSGNNQTFAKNNNTHISKTIQDNKVKNTKTFDISGSFNVFDPIIINLKNYKEEDIYIVNFGDKIQSYYNSAIITHQYAAKGRYKLTVLNTKTYVVESKYIFIDDKKKDERITLN